MRKICWLLSMWFLLTTFIGWEFVLGQSAISSEARGKSQKEISSVRLIPLQPKKANIAKKKFKLKISSQAQLLNSTTSVNLLKSKTIMNSAPLTRASGQADLNAKMHIFKTQTSSESRASNVYGKKSGETSSSKTVGLALIMLNNSNAQQLARMGGRQVLDEEITRRPHTLLDAWYCWETDAIWALRDVWSRRARGKGSVSITFTLNRNGDISDIGGECSSLGTTPDLIASALESVRELRGHPGLHFPPQSRVQQIPVVVCLYNPKPDWLDQSGIGADCLGRKKY